LNRLEKEKMPSLNELPVKCIECAKSNVSRLLRKCRFCNELEFEESVLCDLNRCIQDKSFFECHAFQPILKLVDPLKNNVSGFNNGSTKEIKKKSFLGMLQSDKIKYERALALQKLGRDPDGVYGQIKYHLSWNVSLRRAVFSPAKDFIDFVNDTFLKCSELAGGFVKLLYLAPDHVHLYVESDEELSIEDIVHRIKRSSNNTILEKFPLIQDKLSGDTALWDETYFVETIG
jgi:REP element-mobilizing transposase RayT